MAGTIFAFHGQSRRAAFIVSSLALVGLQQIVGVLLTGDDWFFLGTLLADGVEAIRAPWLALWPVDSSLDGVAITLLLFVMVASMWLLGALAFRRTETTGSHPAWAALVVVPLLQLGALGYLAWQPDRPEVMPPEQIEAKWRSSLVGMLAGASVGLLGSACWTLVFGDYGWGLFLGTPLVMGFVAARLANQHEDIGRSASCKVALWSVLLGGLAMLALAIEGLVCLLMAVPLIAVIAVLGALAGRKWALRQEAGATRFRSVALLPLLMAVESQFPPATSFDDVRSIEIAASPAAVWDSVVHMGPIPAQPAAPFGWGLAYPQRGTIRGEGPGAVREGVFSTGVAYERVTVWEPGKRLEFDVLSDPPMMHELSPYRQVHAPHLDGYFMTRDARFRIEPLADGKTRLTLSTRHELNIAPIAYWKPISLWAIHANKRRVLEHFRSQAEARD
jgi:hypothetical protein